MGSSQAALVVKSSPANTGDTGDAGSISGLGRSPGGGHGNPLQYSCLENPMDRGAWWPMCPKSWAQLKWLSMHAQGKLTLTKLKLQFMKKSWIILCIYVCICMTNIHVCMYKYILLSSLIFLFGLLFCKSQTIFLGLSLSISSFFALLKIFSLKFSYLIVYI